MTFESANLPAPRRRWFQFGLRTLFVLMTLVALWLAWELNFIRERQAWLRENPALVPDNTLDATLFAGNSLAPPTPVAIVELAAVTGGTSAEIATVPAMPAAADSSPAPMLADFNVNTSSPGNAPATAPNVTNPNGSVGFSFMTPPPPQPAREATIPLWRRLLGDTAVAEITAPDEWTDADRAHVSRLFPEAELVAPIRFGINGTVTLTADLSPTQDDSDGDMSAAEEGAHVPDGSDSPPTP